MNTTTNPIDTTLDDIYQDIKTKGYSRQLIGKIRLLFKSQDLENFFKKEKQLTFSVEKDYFIFRKSL